MRCQRPLSQGPEPPGQRLGEAWAGKCPSTQGALELLCSELQERDRVAEGHPTPQSPAPAPRAQCSGQSPSRDLAGPLHLAASGPVLVPPSTQGEMELAQAGPVCKAAAGAFPYPQPRTSIHARVASARPREPRPRPHH
ncbi:Hypothetical predicted protein [Marmota monax]|uniref:Uncharacterized protein n=1 Tax=Marmota monax TaxID=9995 RepID=A0A5E4AB70_MARMO|nr:hypothetical protein GHT09_000668 [Marmota monax]VTJ54309.1 Hypothetical predicted protein [Marmota monax]